MTEVSAHTKALEMLAGQFEEINAEDELTVPVEQGKLHRWAWPWAGAEGMPEAYDELQKKMAEAIDELHGVTKAVGKALRDVADYYRQIETAGEDDADGIETD